MRDLERYVKMLAKRVASLEHQNADLRKRLATDTVWRPTERPSDRHKIEHLGSATAAAGVGSLLLRRGATGGATDDDVPQTAEDGATAVPGPTSTATGEHSEPRALRFGRRNMLRLGGATAAVGAGAVLLRPEAAGAATGGNVVQGVDNDAGTGATGLTSTATDTLHLTNSGVGEALHVASSNEQPPVHVVGDGVGGAIFAEANSQAPDASAAVFGGGISGGGVVGATAGLGPGVGGLATVDTGPAIAGVVFDPATPNFDTVAYVQVTFNGFYSEVAKPDGTARALWGQTYGKGSAVVGGVSNPTSNAPGVLGATSGGGAGVEGKSLKGVGGRFTGKTAQIQLNPSTATTHPSTGAAGQFFVDRSNRLWFCRGGASWKQLA
jgi:hypothetical protein